MHGRVRAEVRKGGKTLRKSRRPLACYSFCRATMTVWAARLAIWPPSRPDPTQPDPDPVLHDQRNSTSGLARENSGGSRDKAGGGLH